VSITITDLMIRNARKIDSNNTMKHTEDIMNRGGTGCTSFWRRGELWGAR
jgi:hypothetical protein